MTQSLKNLENYAKLKVLVVDDDRLSSHNLSIQLRFVGETPLIAASDTWRDVLKNQVEAGENSDLLAVLVGQIKKTALPELLRELHACDQGLPLLLLGGDDSANLDDLPQSLQAQLLTLGDAALNYERLLFALNKARQLSGRSQGAFASKIISPTGTAMFRSLSGNSMQIQKVRQILQQVAKRPTSVLVRGESGTGKEIVARNLHYHSGRGECPFIAVNCAAIAPDRNGIELFGHEKAYNNAREAQPGLVEQADGGTLFFDEIGELPLNIQALLLRFLEDKHYQRLGGHELLTADVRVVAGTRQNLEEKMREGKFREDLYFRLSVMPIELPPLRQRVEDIPELIRELISSLENRDQTSVRFNTSALLSLQKHHWPGNVRELANLVERLGIMQPNAVLGVNDLPPEYQYPVTEEAEAGAVEDPGDAPKVVPLKTVPVLPEDSSMLLPLNEGRLQQYLDNFERQLLEVALDDSAGLVNFAAERLRIDAAVLRGRMEAYGIREAAPR
jgi:sigma-54 specific flagellar transcriptional regulator A